MNIAVIGTQVAEVELIYKTKVPAKLRPAIKCSNDAYEILRASWDDNRIELVEQFKILLLNRSGRVLGISEISSGGITQTVVDARIIFAIALKSNACSIILAHNHPSSSVKPSEPDIALTRKIKMAGQLLDIIVQDHLIITNNSYYSFADEAII